METLQIIIEWCKKHIIIFIAIIASLLFAYVSFTSTVSFPIEYIQKIPFGAAIILWCAFLWVKFGIPESWDKLDDRTEGGVNSITEWQKVQLSIFWIFLFSIIAAILAFAL